MHSVQSTPRVAAQVNKFFLQILPKDKNFAFEWRNMKKISNKKQEKFKNNFLTPGICGYKFL